MRLFFDTEFTSLMDKQPELISIGIVDERDEHAFYAELEHDKSKSSHFVEETVYPLLQGIAKPRGEVCANLLAWLNRIRNAEDCIFCCDYIMDERLLRWLLGDQKPTWITVMDISGLICPSFIFSGEPDHPHRHHALQDAKDFRISFLRVSQLDNNLEP